MIFVATSIKQREMPTKGKSCSRSRGHSRSRSHSRARTGSSKEGKGERISHPVRKRATPRTQKKKGKPIAEKSLAELQMVARSHGIPFGGLTRTQLIEKIVAYS